MNAGYGGKLGSYEQDPKVREALTEWAARCGGKVRVPSQPRHRRGYTAELFEFYLDQPDGPGRRTRKLLVKVLPSGQDTEETNRHAKAVSSAGKFVRHMVVQPFLPVAVGDGRWLMFQDIATGSSEVVAMEELSDEEFVPAHTIVITGVLKRWNGAEGQVTRSTAGEYVVGELAAADACDEVSVVAQAFGWDTAADWIDLGKGVWAPNPLRFVDPGSPFFVTPVDYLAGKAHGDLHGGNILIPCPSDEPKRPEEFCLVDFRRYEDHAPLTRDLVCLLLARVRKDLGDLSSPQAEALLQYLVTPTGKPPGYLPPLLAEVIRNSHRLGRDFAGKQGCGDEWRSQYLLSLLSQALICTTYANAGDEGRRRYFRLAVYAAERYVQRAATRANDRRPPIPTPRADRSETGDRFAAATAKPTRKQADRDLRARLGPAWHVNRSANRRRHDQERPATAGHPDGGPPPARRAIRLARSPQWLPPAVSPDRRPTACASDTPSQEGGSPPSNASVTTVPASGCLDPIETGAAVVAVPSMRIQPRSGPKHAAPRCPSSSAIPDRQSGASSHRRWKLWCWHPATISGVIAGALVVIAVGINSIQLTDREETRRDIPEQRVKARTKLIEIVDHMAGMQDLPATGMYTYLCRRTWSRGDPSNVYREEQLWLTSTLSGRELVTTVVGDQRMPAPAAYTYSGNELARQLPPPSQDPSQLRDQIRERVSRKAAETTESAALLHAIVEINRHHLLSPKQRSVILHMLAETPGITYAGQDPAPDKRTGLAFYADNESFRDTLTFDATTGQLLKHELTDMDKSLTLSYTLFLTRTRTDTITSGTCTSG